MFGRGVHMGVVLYFVLLAGVSPAFADAKTQTTAAEAEKYYEDLSGEKDLQALKKKRDAEAERIRDEIFAGQPLLKTDQSEMAKKITAIKVRIRRERNFLSSEFSKGLEKIYQKAVDRFAQKDYASSRSDFEDIELLSPGFKDTRDYLKKLEKGGHQ